MPSTGLVIYEVYGGGGSNGQNQQTAPTYANDYVVLYNPTAAAISLSGHAIQIQNGPGTGSWTAFAITGSPSVAAHSYFLIQLSGNSALGGTVLSDVLTVDFVANTSVVNTQNLGFQNGKVALTSDTTPLNSVGTNVSATLASTATLIDLVSYGTPNLAEGTAAPSPSGTTSIYRDAIDGGFDTDSNSADFKTHAPAPRTAAYGPDTPPSFTSSATQSIVENTTAVAVITATDAQAHTPLVYSIAPGGHGSLFSIDAGTGALSFLAAPDFENGTGGGVGGNDYQLTVRATDSGGMVNEQLITVTVTDGPEPPTDIQLSAASVQEFAANTTVIGALTATDPDSAAFTYEIVGGGAGGRFAISGTNLVVADGLLLDFEQAASHQVTIRVKDAGNLSFDETFTIAVANIDPENVTGDSAANTFVGGAGADTFDGAGGADILTGGAGNDTYVFDGLDTIIEAAGGGTDTVLSAVTAALAANVEVLVLTGTTAISGTGNTLANVLDGSDNTAANLLRGLAGNDAYIVGAGDTIAETVTGGIDTVISDAINLNLNLYANVERAVAAGSAGLNLTGTAAANVLTGNTGHNVIAGGRGNDVLTGGAGMDAFVFNSALSATTNRDVIRDFIAADDTIRLENAVFKSLGAAGALAPSKFWASATGLAHDATDRIIYNKTTGVLSYDADGNGAGAAVAFAVLTAKPVISAADFLVV